MFISILAAGLITASVSSESLDADPVGRTITVPKGSVVCLSSELAKQYQQAVESEDDAQISQWLSTGCSQIHRTFRDQRMVRRTPYGIVIKMTNGRWVRERHVISD